MGFILAKDVEPGHPIHGYGTPPAWVPAGLWHLAISEPAPEGVSVQAAAKRLIEAPMMPSLWEALAEKYPASNYLSLELPAKCAEYLAAWDAMPRRKPAEHRKFREGLRRQALQLASELEAYFAGLESDCGEGMGPPNFTQFLTEPELQRMEARMAEYNYLQRNCTTSLTKEDHQRARVEYEQSGWWEVDGDNLIGLLISSDPEAPGIVPNVPELLRRVGKLFNDDADHAPLERPASDNAARNYFARRLIGYFQRRERNISPALIARIVAVFHANPMTDNDVQQQIGRMPSGRLTLKRSHTQS